MVRVAVCDDDNSYLYILEKMITDKLTENNIEHDITSYLSETVFLEHHKLEPYNVVFLDIVMPHMNGFEIAGEIKKLSDKTYVIFVTTENELVYDSFDYQPFGFICKSDIGLLEKRLVHVIERLSTTLSLDNPIKVSMAYGDLKYVKPVDILYVQSNRNYLDYMLFDNQTIHVRGKLDNVMTVLSDKMFIRIHNRNIVNMINIYKVDYPNNLIIMKNGTALSLSRQYKKAFEGTYARFLRNFN